MAIPKHALRRGSKWSKVCPQDLSKHFEILQASSKGIELKCIVTGVVVRASRAELEDAGKWCSGWN